MGSLIGVKSGLGAVFVVWMAVITSQPPPYVSGAPARNSTACGRFTCNWEQYCDTILWHCVSCWALCQPGKINGDSYALTECKETCPDYYKDLHRTITQAPTSTRSRSAPYVSGGAARNSTVCGQFTCNWEQYCDTILWHCVSCWALCQPGGINGDSSALAECKEKCLAYYEDRHRTTTQAPTSTQSTPYVSRAPARNSTICGQYSTCNWEQYCDTVSERCMSCWDLCLPNKINGDSSALAECKEKCLDYYEDLHRTTTQAPTSIRSRSATRRRRRCWCAVYCRDGAQGSTGATAVAARDGVGERSGSHGDSAADRAAHYNRVGERSGSHGDSAADRAAPVV